MTGEVRGLGFNRMSVSVCKGCGESIEWGRMFGKRHPFNLDGTSHFDSCPNAAAFRKGRGPSLWTLAAHDTFYRQRWRERFLGDGKGFDLGRLSVCPLPWKVALRLGEALHYVGGPMATVDWPPPEIAQHCYAGAANDVGLVAVSVSKAILYRLRDYLGESEVRMVYSVAGLYLVHGSGREQHREVGWS